MAINLQKITLEKTGDSHVIDLSKKNIIPTEQISINLNWSKSANKGFFGKLFSSAIDLDLGCFYELENGEKSVIDGLQFSKGQGGSRNIRTRQGCFINEPWIWHTGDDRVGSLDTGESIIVNPIGLPKIKRIIVYCFIYDGVAKWEETNAIVSVKIPGNSEIEVQMGKHNNSNKFCAIAEILISSDSMRVKKLVSFHDSHYDCDKKYLWGMRWNAGSK